MDGDERPSSWHITTRVEELAGEHRANALRVAGLVVFYSIEVLNFRGLSLGGLEIPRVEGVDETFHAMATALAVAWMALAAGVMISLRNRFFPPALKYVSTGLDAMLITAVLTLADGPRSPVLLLYFLVIPLAALRLSRRLVVLATAATLVGYATLLGDVVWRRPDLAVPTHWAITTFASLFLAGVVCYQWVVMARRAAQRFSELERRETAS